MAGNRIKGITVEIGGDTTKLQTALKGVNTEIRNTQSQLKDVLGDQKGQQGNLVITVYLGNQLLDEVIVTAQQRMSLRSGGR